MNGKLKNPIIQNIVIHQNMFYNRLDKGDAWEKTHACSFFVVTYK